MIGPKQIFRDQSGCPIILVGVLKLLRSTVFLVKLLNLEDISALLNGIKIELVPPGQCCKPWSWYVGQGMEVEPTDGSSNGQQQRQDHCCLYRNNLHNVNGVPRSLDRRQALGISYLPGPPRRCNQQPWNLRRNPQSQPHSMAQYITRLTTFTKPPTCDHHRPEAIAS